MELRSESGRANEGNPSESRSLVRLDDRLRAVQRPISEKKATIISVKEKKECESVTETVRKPLSCLLQEMKREGAEMGWGSWEIRDDKISLPPMAQ